MFLADQGRGVAAPWERSVDIRRPHPEGRGDPRLTAFWGIAPVAPIHFGLDSILATLRELDHRGWQLTVLTADLHLTLSHGLVLNEAAKRADYYRAYLQKCCNLRARFLRGSDLQRREDYLLALLDACKAVSVSKAKGTLPSRKSPDRVSPTIASMLYPVMQCVDALAVGSRAIVADQGQKKIYALLGTVVGSQHDPAQRRQKMLMVPTGVDILGRALNGSTRDTRIEIHETEESLARKIRAMYAPPADQSVVPHRTNALLWYFRYSVFPWIQGPLRMGSGSPTRFVFHDADSFERAYARSMIHPLDAKEVLQAALWNRIGKARERIAPELCSWIRR